MDNCEILQQDIQSLLEYFSKVLYKAKDCENGSMGHEVMQKCAVLTKLDYSVIEISNTTGELSSHYPSQILVPEYENTSCCNNINKSDPDNGVDDNGVDGNGSTDDGIESNGSSTPHSTPLTICDSAANDPARLRDLINKARFARCRARFPLPVILFKGKYICRSATLSGGPEIYGRSGLDYFFYGVDTTLATTPTTTSTNTAASSTARNHQKDLTNNGDDAGDAYEAEEDSTMLDSVTASTIHTPSCTPVQTPIQSVVVGSTDKNSGEWQLFDRVRSQDIKLLKSLNIGTIVDFMVEKKKVKFGMNVTSSEKVDKEKRYSDFTIISLPYPGCEFFREFRDNNYSGEGLVFDWGQAYVDANIGVPDDLFTNALNIDWDNYKAWDLVKITQNYLKLLLKQLEENSSGLLIHCISGWDRTPLFVSLLRLSLWADGQIHQSLNAIQMLYLTIAYDWFLFGHNLPDRLCKGEEIFFFCFYVLKHIMDDEFSTVKRRPKSKHSSGSSSIAVIRTDSECAFDGILLEGGSRGSSISLNSTCSCASGKCSHQDINTSQNTLPEENINGNLLGNSHDSNSSVGCISNDSNLGFNHQAWSPQPKRTSPVSVPAVASNFFRQRQESSSSLSVGSWQMISNTGSLRSSDSATALQSFEQRSSGGGSVENGGSASTTTTLSSNHSCSNNHNTIIQNNISTYGLNNHSLNLLSTQTNSGVINSMTTPNANQFILHQQQQQQQQHHATHPRTRTCDEVDMSATMTENTILDDDCFTSDYTNDLRRNRLTAVRSLFYNCYRSTIGFKIKGGQENTTTFGTLLGNFAEKVGLAQRTSV
ncbi:myotubularin-related protein 14 [Culicoides brevitarsis]|uniref:myotubularin-related protein 14 n=1 Tax=Culicoides brevitarsis TaxID=469753 RepID=UPI00307B86AD